MTCFGSIANENIALPNFREEGRHEHRFRATPGPNYALVASFGQKPKRKVS